jgi:glycosyltransferase involved in cell wall biosynthesis
MKRILYIEDCNYYDFPVGGQLTFARQMLSVFGNRLVLAGISTSETEEGKWVKKVIDGIEYDFFAYATLPKVTKRPIIPSRVNTYLGLKRYKRHILSNEVKTVFLRSQHLLLEISNWKLEYLCYYFPGVENPLAISRYPWAKPIAFIFDRFFLPKVNKAHTVLAASDQESINSLSYRSNYKIDTSKIISFPTRVDTTIFHQAEKNSVRNRLNVPTKKIIIVTTGRLHWAKGWRLLLDSFIKFVTNGNDAVFYFIGDGEERPLLENEVQVRGFSDRVFLLGQKAPTELADYLKAADLFVLGSLREGWCTSLVEALACGLPIVTTDVSSAKEIVKDGVNGYIVSNRNSETFSTCLAEALKLQNVRDFSRAEVQKYALEHLGKDLVKLCPQLRP